MSRVTGYLFAIASSVGLGAAVALSRAAYDGGTDPLPIATMRSIAGSLLLGGVYLAMGRRLTCLTSTPVGQTEVF